LITVDEKGSAALFSVRVSPGASRTRVLGEHDGALKIAVAAAPEKGKANRELVGFLSSLLAVKGKSLSVASGQTSRAKRVAVEGIGAEALREILSRIVTGIQK
jgi:uncharacterized protein (TIGR00251 family)